MKDLIQEVQEQVIRKAKKENRKDFENLFKEVMKERLDFYRIYEEHFEENVNTLEYALNK